MVALLDNNAETLELEAKMAWPTIRKFTIPLPGKIFFSLSMVYIKL